MAKMFQIKDARRIKCSITWIVEYVNNTLDAITFEDGEDSSKTVSVPASGVKNMWWSGLCFPWVSYKKSQEKSKAIKVRVNGKIKCILFQSWDRDRIEWLANWQDSLSNAKAVGGSSSVGGRKSVTIKNDFTPHVTNA